MHATGFIVSRRNPALWSSRPADPTAGQRHRPATRPAYHVPVGVPTVPNVPDVVPLCPEEQRGAVRVCPLQRWGVRLEQPRFCGKMGQGRGQQCEEGGKMGQRARTAVYSGLDGADPIL